MYNMPIAVKICIYRVNTQEQQRNVEHVISKQNGAENFYSNHFDYFTDKSNDCNKS